MAQVRRIGQILKDGSHISEHDVQEILVEQEHNGRSFGQIALAWGLCQPTDLWRAWSRQLALKPQRINLDTLGVDANSSAYMSHELAQRFCAVPVREVDGALIIATPHPVSPELLTQLPVLLQREIRVVIADAEQIHRAQTRCYGRPEGR